MSMSELLRAATRPAHDRIEAAFDLPSRLASREAYRDLLLRLSGFHAAFEAAAAPHLAGTPFTAYLGRTSRLADDLDRLGTDEAAAADGPGPAFADLAEALGGLYVVEGSILGGVVIAAEVRRRLGIGPEDGAGFFAGHGRETAATWRGFVAALDGEACPDGTVAVRGAERTYAAMQDWLCGPESRRPPSPVEASFAGASSAP